jgi:uncharacterized membrane protein (UPF0127 family)
MKKLSILAFFAICAVACQPDLPPLPSKSTVTTTGTTTSTTGSTAAAATTSGSTTGASATSTTGKEPTTSAATTAGTTASTSTTGTTVGAGPKPGHRPGDNPKRVFQLKDLEHVSIKGNNHSIDAFVADDDLKAAEGLMWVKNEDLKDNQGMIFAMPSADAQKFWMQNTLIPLDIIYISADQKVVNIVHGKPRDETGLPSTGPAKFVLELKDGTASKLGIGPGTKLDIPATVLYKGTQQPGGMNFGQ